MKLKYAYILLISLLIAIKSMAQVPELCVPSAHETFEYAFTNDDKMMISLGAGEMQVWLTEGPFLLKTIAIPGLETIGKTDLYVLPDNKKLIVNLDGKIRRLNLETLEWDKTIWNIAIPQYTGLSKNGKSLYYVVFDEDSDDVNIFKLGLETGVINKVFHLDKENAGNLGADFSVSKDESLLLSGSVMGSVLLDLKNSKVLHSFDYAQRPLFINDAGNLIVSSEPEDDNSNNTNRSRKVIVQEIEPRTMKVVRSMNIPIQSETVDELGGELTVSHNNRDKMMFEIYYQFYIVNLNNFTYSKRQKVKFENDGFELHQAVLGGEMIINLRQFGSFQSGISSLSAGGSFAFFSDRMTAFKISDVKKPYQFGILPYQPFTLSDVSQGEDLKVLAGDKIISFEPRGLSFVQLPRSESSNFTSAYRYIPSQKQLFMNGVQFSIDDESQTPLVYDLKNDVSQVKHLQLDDEESYAVSAMREYDSLNLIVLVGSDRFIILDTRTLKVKQQVFYGNEYQFEQSPGQANDNFSCALSDDRSKLIVRLLKDGGEAYINVIACYSLQTKVLIWKYESALSLSNPVYSEGGKKVRFFTDKKECITLNALTGKLVSSAALIPNSSDLSFFSKTQKYVLNVNIDPESELGDILNYEVYDAVTKKLVVSLPPQHAAYLGAVFMSNDRFLLTQDDDMKLWDLATGKSVAHIITFHNSKDWIMLTPDGRFDGSQDGLKQLYYVKGQEIIPLEQLYEGFYTPGLMKQVLDGSVAGGGPDIKNIKSAPLVKIGIPIAQRNLVVEDDISLVRRYTMTTDKISLTVDASGTEDAVAEIRLFHNGKIVGSDTRNLVVEDDVNTKTKSQVFNLQLSDGENAFKAVALNTQRTESKPDEIIVIYKAPNNPNPQNTETEIQLHLIVVGINTYKNPKYNLNYATADATSFKEAIEKGGNSIFSKTNVVFLSDEKATKVGISAELEKVKAAAKPQDVFIFYFAGHGVMNDNKQFFIVPFDVTQLYGNDDALAQKGFSANLIQQYSKDIKAQKQLFVLDACQSAGALDQIVVARGAAEEKAIAQLARSTGTHWLTASGSEQFASEFSQLGHGTFTYVLLEALSGKADTGDHKITIKEIDAYLQSQVPELTAKYRGTPQYPASYGYGNDFPLIILK